MYKNGDNNDRNRKNRLCKIESYFFEVVCEVDKTFGMSDQEKRERLQIHFRNEREDLTTDSEESEKK